MTEDSRLEGHGAFQESGQSDTTVPRPARVHDALMGGMDNFAAGRQAAARLSSVAPEISRMARGGDAFRRRVVRYLAGETGTRQFIEIGAGLPGPGSTHEVAQAVDPMSRVVHADSDPIVLAHGRALLETSAEGTVRYIDADVLDPGAIVAGAQVSLDFSQPIAVLLIDSPGFVTGSADLGLILAEIMAAVPAGSYLVIVQPPSGLEGSPAGAWQRGWAETTGGPVARRSREEIARIVAGLGLDLTEPGVVPVPQSQPEAGDLASAGKGWPQAALARKPAQVNALTGASGLGQAGYGLNSASYQAATACRTCNGLSSQEVERISLAPDHKGERNAGPAGSPCGRIVPGLSRANSAGDDNPGGPYPGGGRISGGPPAPAGKAGIPHSYREELMMRFTGRRSKAARVAATATAAVAVAALVLCGVGGGTPRSAMRASLAGSDTVCSPAGSLPITIGGVLSAPGYCPGTQGGSAPQVPTGQQGQQCQLTEEQQQELVVRAQDLQAAADQAFQGTLLKNLLIVAAAKASYAALSAQLSGASGLTPQDVASLIQNGSVTPADLVAAILPTLQELGESSGDIAIDTCTGIEDDSEAAANSSGDPQAGGNEQGGKQGATGAPGVNVPADPLAAAVNRNVDLSKITPRTSSGGPITTRCTGSTTRPRPRSSPTAGSSHGMSTATTT